MVKFVKGVYAFTKEEVEALIENYQRGEFIKMGRKTYVQLHIKKKNNEIDKNQLEELIFQFDSKKDIYEKLGSCFYKFEKFCRDVYATTDIFAIRDLILQNAKLDL